MPDRVLNQACGSHTYDSFSGCHTNRVTHMKVIRSGTENICRSSTQQKNGSPPRWFQTTVEFLVYNHHFKKKPM